MCAGAGGGGGEDFQLVRFTAQHSLGGYVVLRWSSPSGRRKEGSRGNAHTLASLDWSLRSQGG